MRPCRRRTHTRQYAPRRELPPGTRRYPRSVILKGKRLVVAHGQKMAAARLFCAGTKIALAELGHKNIGPESTHESSLTEPAQPRESGQRSAARHRRCFCGRRKRHGGAARAGISARYRMHAAAIAPFAGPFWYQPRAAARNARAAACRFSVCPDAASAPAPHARTRSARQSRAKIGKPCMVAQGACRPAAA